MLPSLQRKPFESFRQLLQHSLPVPLAVETLSLDLEYNYTIERRRRAVLAYGVFHAIDLVNAVVSYAQGYFPFEALIVAGSIDTVLVGLCWWELNS